MSLGLLGKKVGMTRVFDHETGAMIAVTVVDVAGNEFVQKKITEKDGYAGVQVGYEDQKEHRVNQAEMGHFKANKAAPKKLVREFRFDNDEALDQYADGHPGVELFQDGQYVDVIGTTKGKGFQGVVKRWGFGGLPMTHGSMMHRRPGGVGAGTWPGRIWKNKKMPGRHGHYRRTVQNLKVVQVRGEDNVLLISGAVPGPNGSYVVVRPAVKKPLPAAAK